MEDLLELLRGLSEPVEPPPRAAPTEQVAPVPADRRSRGWPELFEILDITTEPQAEDPEDAVALPEEAPLAVEAPVTEAAEPAVVEPEAPAEPAAAEPVVEAEPAVEEPPLPRERPAPEPVEPETPDVAEEAAAPDEPPRVFQTACPAVIAGAVEAEMLPPVSEGQCSIRSPLSVTAISVNGRMLPLSSPVTVGCEMATQLPGWAEEVEGYFVAREKTRLETLLTGTSYMCRNVNNADEGRLSEHAFGNAVDIVGFALEDGRSVTLPEGWSDPLSVEGRALRFAHGAACSRFMTTLGPEANALHHDHLHLDMGCHGERCEARLCE
ncbi:MAG: extensin family protein [Hyphomicrobium sp.]